MTSKSWRGMPFKAALALALMGALALGAGCNQDKNKYQEPPPPKVTVAKPLVMPVTVYAAYTGTTAAYAQVEVKARVEGYLDQVTFKPSTRVKAGDLLFVIEQGPYQAKLDQANADVATQEANLQLAEATLIRKANAYKQRAVSEVEVIQAKAEKAKAEAGLEAAKAEVENAKIDLGYTTIRTPIEGKVSRQMVDVGNLVGAGQPTLLTTVVDDDPIYAYFNIPERDLLRYQEDYRKAAAADKPRPEDWEPLVFMGVGGGRKYPYKGTLDYINNQIDQGTGTIQVRGVFPNPEGEIIAGMFVRLRVPLNQIEKALLVPDAALGADQGGRYVLVVDDKNEVDRRSVEIGDLEGDLRVILKGLTSDERVVIKGVQRARPGAKVTPEEAKLDKSMAELKDDAPAAGGQAGAAGKAPAKAPGQATDQGAAPAGGQGQQANQEKPAS